MTKTRKNMKRSNNKNRNRNRKRFLKKKRYTNKIYKGGFYYTTCKGLQKLYDKCCPAIRTSRTGMFKGRGVQNQTRQCKLIGERIAEAWNKTNRQSGPIPRGTNNEMSNLSQEEDEDEDESPIIPSPQPINKYGRPIKQSSSNSGCIIS